MLDGFEPAAVDQIRQRLDLVRRSGVKILFAIESGSRAWGFPSPDSDYDCRFVYLWPAEDQVVLNVQRDVIEFPIEGEIDAGGWDLRKALLLALRGNVVIREWATSPDVYEEVPGFRKELVSVLDSITEPRLVARHYLGLLRRHSDNIGASEVTLKRLFYAIRPALALHYMEERDFRALPPMNLGALLAGVRLDGPLAELINSLVETKKVTREMGTGPVPSLLRLYLEDANLRFGATIGKAGLDNLEDGRERFEAAERFYRAAVRRNSA